MSFFYWDFAYLSSLIFHHLPPYSHISVVKICFSLSIPTCSFIFPSHVHAIPAAMNTLPFLIACTSNSYSYSNLLGAIFSRKLCNAAFALSCLYSLLTACSMRADYMSDLFTTKSLVFCSVHEIFFFI